MAEADSSTKRLSLVDLQAMLEEVGLAPADVSSTEGLRVTVDARSPDGSLEPDAPVVAYLTIYARDSEGKWYYDPSTNDAAKETRRFYLHGDLHLSKD